MRARGRRETRTVTHIAVPRDAGGGKQSLPRAERVRERERGGYRERVFATAGVERAMTQENASSEGIFQRRSFAVTLP